MDIISTVTQNSRDRQTGRCANRVKISLVYIERLKGIRIEILHREIDRATMLEIGTVSRRQALRNQR